MHCILGCKVAVISYLDLLAGRITIPITRRWATNILTMFQTKLERPQVALACPLPFHTRDLMTAVTSCLYAQALTLIVAMQCGIMLLRASV